MAMSLWMANTIIGARKKRISQYNNVRFFHKGFEYKLVYESGFFGFLKVYRRPEWKSRGHFQFVNSFVEDDLSMDDVIGFIKEKVA